MLDILEDFLVLRRIPFARLDGRTSRPRRTLDIKLVSCVVESGFPADIVPLLGQFQQEKSRKLPPFVLSV